MLLNIIAYSCLLLAGIFFLYERKDEFLDMFGLYGLLTLVIVGWILAIITTKLYPKIQKWWWYKKIGLTEDRENELNTALNKFSKRKRKKTKGEKLS